MMHKTEQKNVRTADVIATLDGKFVLIERLKSPLGLALPGGHVDPGELPRQAATREFTEETGLTVTQLKFVTWRRNGHRDPRYQMSQTNVYAGIASGTPRDEKGFTKVVLLSKKEVLALPLERFAFDHHEILMQFIEK
jgi:8-oxo-dGTP diphosphatase